MWDKKAEQELIELTQALIRIDTSNPPGGERPAAEYIASVLEREGIPYHIYEKAPGRSNIAVVLEGENPELPVMLISHIDVVPVEQEAWTHPGFAAEIVDNVMYGRGTIDTKHLTAMELLAMIMIVREKKPLKKSIIFIASADEENGSEYGMEYLVNSHPELFPPACVLSEGGGFTVEQKGRLFRLCACGEKGNLTVTIRVKGDNSFEQTHRLLQVLNALAQYESAEVLTPVTEQFRDTIGEELTDITLRNLWQYSTKHGMHIRAFNLNPAESGGVEIVVDFKQLPGMSEEEIRTLFNSLLSGLKVEYSFSDYDSGYLTSLDNSFARLLKQKSEELDPTAQFLPMIALGSTDGRFIRSNVFGFSPTLNDEPFKNVLRIIHSNDEYVTIPSLLYGGQVVYETLKELVL